MNNFVKAMAYLGNFCKEGNIDDMPRIELVFKDDRERGYFEAILKDSFDKENMQYLKPTYPFRDSMEVYGFKIYLKSNQIKRGLYEREES